EILAKDVFRYYKAIQTGQEPEIAKLRIQYKDYSAWQLSRLNQDSFKVHKEYWVDKLSGELPLLSLPGAKQRPKFKTYNGHRLGTYIDKTTTAKLKGYIQKNGGSLFMGLLASWNVLMYRYTSQKDIIIGTPVAGREHADLEDQIGFYVNMLALKNEVDPDKSFDSFYKALKEDTLKSYSHQMYPFDRLIKDLNLQRDTSRSAVFDVLLDLHNHGESSEGPELSEEEINQIVDRGYQTSKFDIEVILQENGDYLSLQISFNTDVYERAMVEGLIMHYKQLLTALLETPEEKIAQIDYLSGKEKHELLVTFNGTTVAYQKDKTIVDLFEEQVEKTPGNIAVAFAEKELTYRQVNEKSDQLAAYLQREYNIQPDDLVGIQLNRSEWIIISILGVLKAGGAYVPIDPEYPSSRKEYIAKDTSIELLITEACFIYDIDYFDGKVFAIDLEFDSENYNSGALSKTYTPANLAYVIYTSGSTGTPKGVMVEHASLTNYLSWGKSKYLNDPSSLNFGLFSSLSFDLTVTSIFLPLISGGLINIFDNTSDTPTLVKKYFESEISCIKITPAHISLLGQLGLKSTKVQVAIVGGDKLDHTHVGILRKLNPSIRIYNEYGPTESTVGCIIDEIGFEGEPILIGKPVDNTCIYIVNEKNILQAVGVSGEILIGGDQVARGYLNRSDLTQERFIANPFKEGGRLYKTGDLGRWLADGSIEFIGRKDDQVKIKGYRIEPGEIEYALSEYDKIDQVVVLARENEVGEKALVAYLTSKEQLNTSALRAYLGTTLPEYMFPAYFVQLEELPLTPNGKIDKKALPDPEGLGLSGGVEYVAPRNELEESMVKIWSDVLHVDIEKLGVKDGFFELGGDSIKVIRLLVVMGKEMHYEFSVNEVYNNDTIEKLIQYAKENKNEIDLKNEWLSERERSIRSEIERLKERILSSNGILNKENIEDIYPM
ncbi:non-ribosomal peptide synthetase, partial [Niastella populi]|uniref:non-ribosomal peptide synthetase n=1 Tax=Niastella populi TaxID=550983 RepID=UPI0010554B67